MKIAIGSDHAGFELKEQVKKLLTERGHEVIDFGTNGKDSVDYPDYGIKVGRAVADKEADRGIAVCWTGGGMSIAANKVRGIRAGLCLTKEMAYYSRLHNDTNVLAMSQKYTDPKVVADILETWLATEFEGGRHTRRLDKITANECK